MTAKKTAKKKTAKKKPSAIGPMLAISMLSENMASNHQSTLDILADAASINVDNKIAIESLQSGQAMLSERLQSLYEDLHANDCLTHRRIETLTDLVRILTDSHTGTYATLADHCKRLLAEKETLQRQVAILTAQQYTVTHAPMEREDNLYSSPAAENFSEEELKSAVKFMATPLREADKAVTFQAGNFLKDDKDGDIYWVGAKAEFKRSRMPLACDHDEKSPTSTIVLVRNPYDTQKAPKCTVCDMWLVRDKWSNACDHDILSPRCTVRISDGKRHCIACDTDLPKCGFEASHVSGIQCKVCGVIPS